MTDPVELATRLIGGVWGHLIGDAMGVPYEFREAANRRGPVGRGRDARPAARDLER
jgi:ADP-ribosylglycohydrolase